MKNTSRRILSLLLAILILIPAGFALSAPPDPEPEPGPIEPLVASERLYPNQDTSIGNKYARHPFPQHEQYAVKPGAPSNKTQAVMDQMTLDMFKKILNNNLIRNNGTVNYSGNTSRTYTFEPDRENFMLVSYHSGETGAITVSETQGYFMLELAYMAGCEEQLTTGTNAHTFIMGCESIKEYYDAALRTVQWCPSNVSGNTAGNPNLLMSWQICSTASGSGSITGSGSNRSCAYYIRSGDRDNATDGDLDIIYSLIIADKQWGSEGQYNYKQIAVNMMKSFWGYCTHPTYRYLLMADWAYGTSTGVTGNQRASRPSDWMLDHLEAFKEYDTDTTHNWQLVINATLRAMADIREGENAMGGERRDNGLLSDFIERYDSANPSVFRTPLAQVLEGASDVRYAANSCRVPWRLGTAYLLFGDSPVITSNGGINNGRTLYTYCVEKLDWLARTTTNGNFSSTTTGSALGSFNMDGTNRSSGGADYKSPFLVTAVAVNNNQAWVDAAWSYGNLTSQSASSGWAEHLTLFPLMVASSNYWNPMQPAPDAPANLAIAGGALTWDAVNPPVYAYKLGGYRIYQNGEYLATTTETSYEPADVKNGDEFSIVAFVAEDNVSQAAVIEWSIASNDGFPPLYPAWPFTPVEWVLYNMSVIDVAKWGYEQYDVVNAIKRSLGVSGQGSMGSSACTVASADRTQFTSSSGQYYALYQKLLDDEAYMIKAWLSDMATPRPGEDWQHHMSRIAQTEYMFTDAPGYYGMVESGRRTSILGSSSLAGNADFQKIAAWQVAYEKKFQDECYGPGKIVEKQIDCMDPSNPIEISAARAAYDVLDNLTKSVVMNYEKLTRAESFVFSDGTDKVQPNFQYIGMRKEVGASGVSAAVHQGLLGDLLSTVPGTKAFYIWISGNSSGSMRIGTSSWTDVEASGVLQKSRDYYTSMGLSITTDSDMESFFTYLDSMPGAEVYVQVENMNRMVEPQIDVLRYLAVKHPCVKGFAMDIEWYNHSSEDCGLRVSNERCKAWNEYIYKTWGSGYSLALKHYDAAHLPDEYRGGEEGKSNPVIFIDDTQNYGSWDGSHGGKYNAPEVGNGSMPANGNDWSMFAEYFYPNRVIFQTGYQHDEQWSYSFDAVDPAKPLYIRSHANKIAEVVNPDQITGLAWVNFNRDGYPEFPTYNMTRRGASSLLSTLASRTISYLANFNGNESDYLWGGNYGFFTNATGRRRNLTNNPLTINDALLARNVRQYAKALIAKGATASNFTGNSNYGRFLGVEVRAFDTMVSYIYDIVKKNGGYKPARDRDDILILIDTYEGFSATATCTFPTGTDAIAGYTNGAVQKAAVTKYNEYLELVGLMENYVEPFPAMYPAGWDASAPGAALQWVLYNMSKINIDKWGYEQYDVINAVHRGILNNGGTSGSVWGPGTMSSAACTLSTTERAMFTSVTGQYYNLYQNFLNQEAQMVQIWLKDISEPREGENWQTHFSRMAQAEYMFTEAPGYYLMVQPNLRVSILGADEYSDNVYAKRIDYWQGVYEKKFQNECYKVGKAVEKQIAYMDPSNAAEVAAMRAVYNGLDNLTKSVILNYEILTRAEGFVKADGTDEIQPNIKYIGMRKPVGGDTSFTASNHIRALYDLQRAAPSANPWYVWIAGNSSGQLRIGTDSWSEVEASGVMQHSRAYYEAMGISISTDAIMDEFLTYLDKIPGAEVYLQVENMNRMVEPQMDIMRYVATKHPSVKGFAMDIEWYNHNREDCGLRVSNERAKAWNEYIYATWGAGYGLALKHYDAHHLPDVYRGGEAGLSNPIVFIDDTQNYGAWDGSHGGRYNDAATGNGSTPANGNDWSMFATFFYPNPVIFQTGYQHDEQWSYSMDAVDFNEPLYIRSHANKIAEVVNPGQTLGIAWVNFNRNGYPEFPNSAAANDVGIPGTGWRTRANQLSELTSRTIAYLSNYNGDSNNLLGGNWGFFSNAAGRGRTQENNPLTYFDGLWAYNVRQYANALIEKGAAASGFVGTTNYTRFLGVEARAFDIMVAYNYDIVMNGGGYKPARDMDNILLLINMYEGLSDTATCVFPTGTDAIPGYVNGTIQKEAVTKYNEYRELYLLVYPIKITSININAPVSSAVTRGKTYEFKVILNEGALDKNIIWSINNPLYANVSPDGTVTILNKTGTAVLTAFDPVSGLSHSIILRIT